MHGFDLSFEVISLQMTLDEISKALGIPGSRHSREKGAPITKKSNRIAEVTAWRLFSDAGIEATLEQHFEKLLEKMRRFKMPPQDIRAALAKDCELRFASALRYFTRWRKSLFFSNWARGS